MQELARVKHVASESAAAPFFLDRLRRGRQSGVTHPHPQMTTSLTIARLPCTIKLVSRARLAHATRTYVLPCLCST